MRLCVVHIDWLWFVYFVVFCVLVGSDCYCWVSCWLVVVVVLDCVAVSCVCLELCVLYVCFVFMLLFVYLIVL